MTDATTDEVTQDSPVTEVHGSSIDEAVMETADDITTNSGREKPTNGKLAIWLFLSSDFLFSVDSFLRTFSTEDVHLNSSIKQPQLESSPEKFSLMFLIFHLPQRLLSSF